MISIYMDNKSAPDFKIFDKPITTLEQAKVFFRAMGCSHFHMDREYPDRSKEYDGLKISRQTEKEWIQEQFNEFYASIMENADANSLWKLHANMADLLPTLRSQTALVKMLEVTQFISDKVPLKDRIIVAETINGRTARIFRQGLIYWAHDWKNKPAAKAFAELSLHFAQFDEKENRGYERSKQAIELCNAIKRRLRL
jgi:hypothetical protein